MKLLQSDPSLAPTACEVCGTALPLGECYSLAVVWLHVAGKRDPFQCPDEQHFACCHDHALQLAHTCLDEHVHPQHDKPAQSDVRFQHPALSDTHPCHVCGTQAKGTDMFGIHVNYRMPGPGFASWVCEDIHLGCSPECAVKAAHSCLDEHATSAQHESRKFVVEETPNGNGSTQPGAPVSGTGPARRANLASKRKSDA